MKKKSIAVAALASCLALSATFTGCSLVSTNSKADMAQEIATVNITRAENFDSNLKAYKEAITGETAIIKRDLVSYFLNVGYSYVQNNMSYEDIFNMLIDALIDNAILVQYSTMALLENKAETEGKSAEAVLAEYMKADKTQAQKYEYLLDGDNVQLAKYNLYSSLNSAIDNYEKTIIKEESEYTGTATRTTPVNLNTEQDDYYPRNDDGITLNYNVYTGYAGNLLENSGAYKDDALEGTTTATRIKAYNKYLNVLRSNDLIEDGELGDLRNVDGLKYVQDEYVNQLESRIINKYYDVYEKQQEETLKKDNYIDNIYQQMLKKQKSGYDTASAFETALGSMSSSSFLLYSPDTSEDNELEGAISGYSEKDYGRFGLVYNILLPFNAKQSAQLSELKSILGEDDDYDYYYSKRNALLSQIKTEDQRAAWFNGTTDYSFKASEAGITPYGASDYLFFEGNLTDSEKGGRYKKLQAYEGKYSYNGQVYENEDGSYTLLGNELDIDEMLKEFKEYINWAITGDEEGGLVEITERKNEFYGETNFYKQDDEDEIDYTKFLYAYGKVDLGGFNKNDLFNAKAQSNQYTAMSAVNELQFAYTTDTSVLSQYAGYSVSAYDTSYIKEFEYAAKLAISNGEGAFTVCAGDYGWHLIYVTYVFDGGEVYSPDWTNNIKVEGTFENLFFEWIKGNDLSDVTTSRRSKIVNDFNKEDVTVVKYPNRYNDLLELSNN